jgi:hypothetical protein
MSSDEEWSASTLYALGDQVLVTDADYHHEFESLSGGTSHAVTISNASPGVVTWTAHGLPPTRRSRSRPPAPCRRA